MSEIVRTRRSPCVGTTSRAVGGSAAAAGGNGAVRDSTPPEGASGARLEDRSARE